jgi:hypothetical protein
VKRPDPRDVPEAARRRPGRARRRDGLPAVMSPGADSGHRTPCRELPPPPPVRDFLAAGMIEPGARYFAFGGCSVILARGPAGWHLSIAHPSRYPTWDEVAEARYRLVPDGATMAMILPPRAEYVDVHPNCFHLYEIGGIIPGGPPGPPEAPPR